MILSLSVHEYAHALVATKLGDDTPELDGRLTLSPVAHIDPIGTLLVPTISILMFGYSFIGWAKPVGFNPVRFRRGIDMRHGIGHWKSKGLDFSRIFYQPAMPSEVARYQPPLAPA